mgnify:CR=1 FL=1|jgi:putative transcriptional regulator
MIIVKLEKILESKNKSLYWLAQETKLSYPTIHRLVNKKTTSIAFDTLDKICKCLTCGVGDILEHIEE